MSVYIFLLCITASSANMNSPGGRQIFTSEKVVPIGENVTVFRTELTLAEVVLDGDRPIRCRLSSIYLPEDEKRIADLFGNVTYIEDQKMMRWVEACGKLDAQIIQENPLDEMAHMMRKIFPGTLWCGAGNIAQNYTQLGPSTETDRCCRNHDFCPVCIPSHTDKYGWKRTFEFSVLSCECDIRFRRCLEKALINDKLTATLVIEGYFDVYDPTCVGFRDGKPTPFRSRDVLRELSTV